MVSIGVFIVKLPDVLRPQLLGIGGVDDAGPDFDDEVPAGTQELRVTPGAADAVGIAFEGSLIVTERVVCIEKRGRDKVANVSFHEPMPPARLYNDMAPLGIT